VSEREREKYSTLLRKSVLAVGAPAFMHTYANFRFKIIGPPSRKHSFGSKDIETPNPTPNHSFGSKDNQIFNPYHKSTYIIVLCPPVSTILLS
jgi:hypothetical protein